MNNVEGRIIKGQTFYTASEVATILNVSVKTVYTYRREGKIKAIKVGRAWLFSEQALQTFLNPVATTQK